LPRLDEQTLHKARRMAAAGATSPVIADRLSLPVEQVEFVCGRIAPGERGGFDGKLPEITEVDGRRCDPAVPFSFLPQFMRMPDADGDDLANLWQHRWDEAHPA